MKKLFGFFDRDRETLQGRVVIHFLEDDQAVPQIRMEFRSDGGR